MRKFAVIMAFALTACGSQWNLPFSSTTVPSSISVNESSASGGPHRSSMDDAAPSGHPFIWPHLVTWHRKNKDYSSWDKVGTHPLQWPDGYDSLDKTVMAQLNSIMASANMEPLASWWGPGDTGGDLFLDAYLTVPGPRVGVLFEVGDCVAGMGLLRFDSKCHVPFDNGTLGAENARLFREYIAYLTTNYFTNPKYADRFLRVGGKAVVFIWLTGAFEGDFKSVANAVKAEFPVWLVGSNMNLYNPPRGKELERILGGLDAVSAYGIADSDLAPTGQFDESYAARLRSALQSWSQWLHDHVKNAILIPPLMFAYDDTQVIGRNNPAMTTTREQARIIMETTYVFIAASQEACGNVAPGTLVVSLNEDFEGSSVYPTREHGNDYMDALREFAGRTLPPRNCH